MCGLEIDSHPNLLIGLNLPDDAGVYKLDDKTALVQTVDFFTPIVDDPYTFGQIAVANALSDVYAMGGVPLTAMNIVCFPIKTMDISVLQEILKGGLNKLKEAGVVLVGGHSVEDPELKYGLSVTGTVHPDKVLANQGARAGDRLVLTKPLGTGIINTAVKGNVASPQAVERVVASMCSLNGTAAEIARDHTLHACTDVTGFGLLGHTAEMIQGTGLGIRIHSSALPFFAEAREYSAMGLLPGGLHRNRENRKQMLKIGDGVPQYLVDLVCDPQTSGGLLLAVPDKEAKGLVAKMQNQEIAGTIIGVIFEDVSETIVIE